MAPSVHVAIGSLAVVALAGLAASAAPRCHAPWGNEKALESPCFTPVYTNGDVSVRQYAPRGKKYEQTFLEAAAAGGGDPSAYEKNVAAAVFDMIVYFEGENSFAVSVNRTSPIFGRPNTTGLTIFDWMIPTSAYPTPTTAPTPIASYNLTLKPSTLGLTSLVAALHFTVTGVPQPGDFDQACDTLLPLLPAVGYTPVDGGLWSPVYAYYTSRDFPGQHDGECLVEVAKG